MSPGPRMSADDRRAAVLRVAVHCFADGGFAGTSTQDVATAAGISHAYLFRLWPTKKALFLDLVVHGFARVRSAFAAAADGLSGEAALQAMGDAYEQLLLDRDQLLLQMQAYVSSDDPEIGEVTRREFSRLWRKVEVASGAGDEEMQKFFAFGMLMNVMAALNAPEQGGAWMKACAMPSWLSGGEPDGAADRVADRVADGAADRAAEAS